MSGPPTVKCVICGDQVNKRQTYSIGNGRACKKHEGVQQQAEQAQQAIADDKQAKADAEAKRREARKPDWMKEDPSTLLHPKCMSCRHLGLPAQDWYARLLLLGEKYELTYQRKFSPFDVKECQRAYSELKGLTPLFYREYKSHYKGLSRDARSAASMMGLVAFCLDCCKMNNIDPLEHMKNITLDQIIDHAAIMEVFVRPELQRIARREIEASN